MRFLVIAAALLSLPGSIHARALKTTSERSRIQLEEVIRILNNSKNWCDNHQTVCSEFFVQEVIPQRETNLHQTEVFCKAAAALQKVKVSEGELKTNLEHLRYRLRVNAPRGITVKCTVDNDVQITLHMFLESLRTFLEGQVNRLVATMRQ